MSKEQTTCKQVVHFVDLTALSEDEQREKLKGLRFLVIEASRKYRYRMDWKDYHSYFVNYRVVNPLTQLVEYMNTDKIKTSDLVFMGKDYDGYFVLASVSAHTIQLWKEESYK